VSVTVKDTAMWRTLLSLSSCLLCLTQQQQQFAWGYAPLSGISAKSLKYGEATDLGSFLSGGDKKLQSNAAGEERSPSSSSSLSLLILGTYAADFNAIEYAQRLRYYLPALKLRGVTKIGMVLNCEEEAAKALCESVDLPLSSSSSDDVEIFVDPTGSAGRAFGVGRGWKPEEEEMSPYLKLFGMLFGLGAWATLPAVIGGYIGNPFRGQPWIEDALAVGQRKGRWPNTALELDDQTGLVKVNKFEELPLVGTWPRRPLELATLRLQNMLYISIQNWDDLKPTQEALDSGVLTQLGGCVITDSRTGNVVYEWKDPGICAVANFEDILKKIPLLVAAGK
jgi:hypothetical protein